VRSRLPSDAEAVLRGLDLVRLDPAMERHLEGCEACQAELTALLALWPVDIGCGGFHRARLGQ
jgi:hypothetical protein